jgi:uncharacterized protein YmfQ (DUF2313 family)
MTTITADSLLTADGTSTADGLAIIAETPWNETAALSAADYLIQLQALLPYGPAWPREPGANLTRMLNAWADELARVDGRAAGLVAEADPRTTSELLADWERVAGLPDACVAIEQTTDQRMAALIARLTSTGGQSVAYFIGAAASIGYTVTITEFDPFSVADDVENHIYGDDWGYAWQVNAAQDTVGAFSATDTVADPLAWWGNDMLECLIGRLKPAHTIALFAYT